MIVLLLLLVAIACFIMLLLALKNDLNKVLCKQAWQELKDYIKITTTIWDTPEENAMRKRILKCMKQLEKRKK